PSIAYILTLKERQMSHNYRALSSFTAFAPHDCTPFILFFFFNNPATTEIYTLSLHDALPISPPMNKPFASAATGMSAVSPGATADRKSTRLNSSHVKISYAVFCLKKKIEQFQSRAQRRAATAAELVRLETRLLSHHRRRGASH